MKFGAQLELYAIPEWHEKYIRYNTLKRFISQKLADLKPSSGFSRIASLSRRGSLKGPSSVSPPLQPSTDSGQPLLSQGDTYAVSVLMTLRRC